MTLPIVLREPGESDLGFILSSWTKAAWDAWEDLRETTVGEWAVHHPDLPLRIFGEVTRRISKNAIAEILQREGTRVCIACDPEDPSVIYGYAVAEPGLGAIHWVHVKHSFRRNGIARELVKHLLPNAETKGATVTYLGRWFLQWCEKWPLRFDPWAGR